MHNTANLDSLVSLEEAAPRNATRSTAPVVRLQREPAVNDPMHADVPGDTRFLAAARLGLVGSFSGDEIEPWSRHAAAANGFGEVASIDGAFSAWPSNLALYQEAHSHRAVLLGEMLAAAMQAVGALARRAYAGYRQWRQARETYMALRELDDRTLHDLGFARDELISIAAEVAGGTERTRVRTVSPRQ
jgi:uncharacterized protein YjiS (DUF1127 family)